MNTPRKFNSEQELKKHIGDNIDLYLKLLKEKVGSLESEYLKSRRQRMIGTFLVIAGVGIWYIHPPIFIPLSLLVLYFGVKKIRATLPVVYKFNKKLDHALYVLVFELLGIDADYSKPLEEVPPKTLDLLPKKLGSIKYVFPKRFYHDILTPTVSEKVGKLLDKSELITEPRNTLAVDNMFTIKMADREMFITELDAKHIGRDFRKVFVKPVFSGLFVVLELPRTLEGKTFISTEVDLLSKELTKQPFDPGALVTELEWNDFEKFLEVRATDPTEARYILTPDFMEDLFDWWQDKKRLGDIKVQVRLSFLGNHMYVLFPDERVHAGNAMVRMQTDELREHLESIAIPLLHIFNLTNDVENRFIA